MRAHKVTLYNDRLRCHSVYVPAISFIFSTNDVPLLLTSNFPFSTENLSLFPFLLPDIDLSRSNVLSFNQNKNRPGDFTLRWDVTWGGSVNDEAVFRLFIFRRRKTEWRDTRREREKKKDEVKKER